MRYFLYISPWTFIYGVSYYYSENGFEGQDTRLLLLFMARRWIGNLMGMKLYTLYSFYAISTTQRHTTLWTCNETRDCLWQAEWLSQKLWSSSCKMKLLISNCIRNKNIFQSLHRSGYYFSVLPNPERLQTRSTWCLRQQNMNTGEFSVEKRAYFQTNRIWKYAMKKCSTLIKVRRSKVKQKLWAK